MADAINYQIIGDDLQLVEIQLDPREGVRAEAGAMTYMEDGVEMQTSTGGGILQGLKRAVTGESFFITSFINQGSRRSSVAFAAPYPGRVVPLDLTAEGGQFICQKDSFLCAAQGIEVEIAFTKRLGAGLFGGEGFILQRLQGNGLAFVHAGGTIIEKTLAQGETIRVDTGCIVGFSTTVDYDISFVGGVRNALFGGEGLFIAKLRGPGKIYLQSLPLSRLADRLKTEKSGAAGLGGDILGKIISGS
ncbi:MAG: TIGR00266 family protein [Anaerolineales bacterium]